MTTPRYIVQTAIAHMPSSCRGEYRRVAVVEIDLDYVDRLPDDGPDWAPAMISDRARGVRRVVDRWERLNVGSTSRCAYRVALAEAEALAARLNAQEQTHAD